MKREAARKPFGEIETALLTPDEAASRLQVTRRTLMTWARRGEIPHVVLARGKDGRASVVRFNSQSLRKWIEDRERK